MLDPHDLRRVSDQFGVAEQQVRRDHLVSHLLAAISRELSDDLLFFGGTALARTHLPNGRLSEDIDLMAVDRRAAIVTKVERVLSEGVRREYGRLEWQPLLRDVSAAKPAVLRAAEGLTIRVQLLDSVGYPRWPTESVPLFQRYGDAPPARIRVPTLAGFTAAKTLAWHDRRAPRDLYDLWGLAAIGAIDAAAAKLFGELGPTGKAPSAWMFRDTPSSGDWHRQLAHQTRIAVGPSEAIAAVRSAWARAIGSADEDCSM